LRKLERKGAIKPCKINLRFNGRNETRHSKVAVITTSIVELSFHLYRPQRVVAEAVD
jgi:hypothetical protein